MVKRVMLVRPEYDRSPYLRQRVEPTEESKVVGRDGADSPLPSFRREGGESSPTDEKKESSRGAVVLDLVGKLSVEERRALLDQLALQALEDEAPRPDDRELNLWSVAVHSALNQALGDEARGDVGLIIVRRQVGARSAWRPVVEFMRSGKLDKLSLAERQSAYDLLAKMVVAHARSVARRSGAPLGPKLVGSCAASVRGLFDASFPGYLRSGLAPLVAKRAAALRA